MFSLQLMQPRRVTWHRTRMRLCQVLQDCQQRQRRQQRQLEQLSRAYRIRQHLRRPDCNKALTLDRHEIVAVKPSARQKRAIELREIFDPRLSSSRISSSSSSLLVIFFSRFLYVPDYVSRVYQPREPQEAKRMSLEATDPSLATRNFSLTRSVLFPFRLPDLIFLSFLP